MISLIACASAYLLLLAAKAMLVWVYVRRYPVPPPCGEFTDVTILQPILGGDPALVEALCSNLVNLPGATFVWLIDEDDSVGWTSCLTVAAKLPNARVQMVSTPPVPQSVNPKLFKLARAEPAVLTPYLVVLDDDTRLSRHGLEALLDGLRDYDVSTALPLYQPGPNTPSRLLAAWVNSQSVLTFLPLLVVAPAITLNGMCYALRTARLRELGGFAPLVHRLTDDLAVARLVREAGGRIRQTVEPLAIATTLSDWRHYRHVMHRWFVFAWLQVRAQNLAWRAIVLAVHGVPPFLLWTVLVLAVQTSLLRWDWIPLGVLTALLGGRMHILASVQLMITRAVAHQPLLSLLSELLQPLHLAHALLSRRIRWRNRVIDVRADDAFSYR